MKKFTFAIMGATGHIGHHLTEELLKRGHHVRALGREPLKLQELKTKGLKFFQAILQRAAFFLKHLKDVMLFSVLFLLDKMQMIWKFFEIRQQKQLCKQLQRQKYPMF
jgi:uncharacterized protein YbjT (DUF2867 family)